MAKSLPDYPFQSHFFEIAGFQYHYIDEGEGDPVLMVHGNPSWSYYYRHLVHQLKGTYRTVAVDHLGCGLSDKPNAKEYSFTLAQRVADLEAFVNHMNFDKPITLVLHDWGGMIGMALATRIPDKINKIVLLNTGAFRNPKQMKLPWQIALVRNTPLGPFLVQGFNAFALGATYTCVTKNPMSAEVRKAYVSPYNNWKNRLATLKFVQNIPLQPHEPDYQFIVDVEAKLPLLKDKPIMIGWGEKDFVFDGPFLQKWQEIYPHAQVHRFPEHGHYILEDAASDINPIIHRFLDQTPAAEAAC
ncbi:MAG: alpha/beta hydrolase [Myxococcales bacterium]|nr:alpha/beta hydrolase [Myxococcales bacterium]|tara:strand:- start:217 stop:1119 length:903 start_codon:yes stop_codon:yes gene_type:complete